MENALRVDYGLCLDIVRKHEHGMVLIDKDDMAIFFFLASERPADPCRVEELFGKLRDGYDRWVISVVDKETTRQSFFGVDVMVVADEFVDVLFLSRRIDLNAKALALAFEIMTPLEAIEMPETQALLNRIRRGIGHRRRRKEILASCMACFFSFFTENADGYEVRKVSAEDYNKQLFDIRSKL